MESKGNRPILKPWPLDWRAKIGLLIPSQEDGYSTYEYQVLFPEGVVPLQTRVMGGKLTLENMMKMRDDTIHGAEMLAVAGVDVICYVPTAASFVWGLEGDSALIKEIEEKVGIKTTTGASCAAEALKFMGIKRMILYSPTLEEITAKSIKYLEDQGFTVMDHESLGLEYFRDANRISPWETYGGVMKVYKRCPDVDGIFLCGACLRTLEMIDTLEKDTGLPAVYTKTANVWRCLQLAGIKEPIYGFGKLLEMDRQVITS